MILLVLLCLSCFSYFPSKSYINQTWRYWNLRNFLNWLLWSGIRLGVSNMQQLLYVYVFLLGFLGSLLNYHFILERGGHNQSRGHNQRRFGPNCVRLVYFLHKSTDFHFMRTKCQEFSFISYLVFLMDPNSSLSAALLRICFFSIISIAIYVAMLIS